MTDRIAPASPELAFEVSRNKQLMARHFALAPVWDVQTIVHVQPNSAGHPAWALTEAGYKVDLSLGTPMAEQEEWLLRLDGGPVSGRWSAVARLTTKGDLLGPLPGRFIPPPVVPTQEFGGWATVEDGESTTAAGGVPRARVTLYPRSVALSAGYDVYSEHYPILHSRIRETGADAWQAIRTDNLHPVAPVFLALNGGVTNASMSWTVTVPAESAAEIDSGQRLFWYCDGECVVGSLAGTTLTIYARAADGTSAAAHDTGASIQLLSAKAPLLNLVPGVSYDVQLAFGGAFAEVGGWSNIVNVVTWEQVDPPVPPENLLVNLDTDAFHLKWDAVPDASVHEYRILRYDGSLPAEGNTVAANIAAGAIDLGLVAALTALIPAHGVVTGAGINFGVAARNSSGLESVVTWQNDDWVPASPDPATVTIAPVPSGLLVTVTDGAPLEASGFQCYVLWQASDTSGTGAIPVFTFGTRQSQSTVPITDYGVVHTYQVVSLNWNNVSSTLDNTPANGYWKYAVSLGPTDAKPTNGDFQLPSADGTLPAFWTFSYSRQEVDGSVTASPDDMSLTYAEIDGLTGNFCVKAASAGGYEGGTLIWDIRSTVLFPFNMRKTLFVTLYFHYSPRQPDFALYVVPYVRLYADAAGTADAVGFLTSPVEFGASSPIINLSTNPAYEPNVWQGFANREIYNYTPADSTSFATFGVRIFASDNGGGLANPLHVWIDDIVAVPAVPIHAGLIITPADSP